MVSEREARSEASAALMECGPIEDRIPPSIEAVAIAKFEAETLATTGHKWDWSVAGEEVRNRYRLMVFVDDVRPTR